jgi:A/G-specific adenine glycosylase
VSRYPDIIKLSEAPEQEVLKLWQGLGYYSRARNLHFAANQVMNDFDGKFPGSYQEIIKLKGVGEYTAAAIASIAYGEPVAVVDGNVKRVISRIYGVEYCGSQLYNRVMQIMTKELDKGRAGDFNQAVMEFGALHCTPKNPACTDCVFSKTCKALKYGKVDLLPLKEIKKKPKARYFSYMVMASENGDVIMKKRTQDDIWKNLFEFPLIETKHEISPNKLMQQALFKSWFGDKALITESSRLYKHQLTHRTIHARFHFVETEIKISTANIDDWKVISCHDITEYPVSRLIDRFLKDQKSKFYSNPNTQNSKLL